MSRTWEEVEIQSQMCSLAAALPPVPAFPRALPFPPALWDVPGMTLAQNQWLIRAEIAAEIEIGRGGVVLAGELRLSSSEIQAPDPS